MDYPAILLADDNPDDVFFLKHAFRDMRLLNPVRVVGNVESLIAYFQGEGIYSNRVEYPVPKIIFLDMHLKRRSGLEMIPWLRQHVSPESCRIFMWGGSSNKTEVRVAHELGANSCLPKPGAYAEYPTLLRNLPGLEVQERGPDGNVLISRDLKPT